MLSYRHGFHAANHADILKHMILCLLLRALNRKEKPYSIIDTHSGSGIYNLKSAMALKNQEFRSGIQRVINNKGLKKIVPEFFEVLEQLRAVDEQAYPGSPYFSASLMRDFDKLTLIDLHPTEFENLRRNFRRDERINIQNRDGLEALGAILPPMPRRGMCFIDPAYEEKNDYHALVKALKVGLSRWSTGVYAVWYPVLGKLKDHSKNLVSDIKRLNVPLIQAELRVDEQDEVYGMCGSGMLILNYPYGLDKDLSALISELYKCLCNEKGEAKLKILVPQP